MEDIVYKLLGQIVNALGGAIIAYLWAMLRSKKRENDALKEGVQALLRDRIIQGYNHYSTKGWIPIYAMESIDACYKSYEELGENGVIDNLMSQLRELPNPFYGGVTMQKFLNMLKKDENSLSVGRFTAMAAFILWAGVSLYLAIKNVAWGIYEPFCLTVVALVLVQLGNKAIECRMFKITGGDK